TSKPNLKVAFKGKRNSKGVHYQSGTLTFDQLRGNLITYEMTILDQNGENKKKSLALKALSQEEESDENDDGEEDKDFALLMKQFNKFAKKKNFNFKGKKKSPPKCFECGE
ncbi:hypothetical protein PIB30_110049, partial [Stylosanthes scabra]|nr:hypothetical protein [Stylosanthes scabra]